MVDILINVIKETFQITLLVTIMMMLVDAVNIWSKGKMALLLRGTSQSRQYVVASFIGAIPGCVGGFTNVTLYMHGLVSFGALAGSMIASSGDEAFVMLAMSRDSNYFIPHSFRNRDCRRKADRLFCKEVQNCNLQ